MFRHSSAFLLGLGMIEGSSKAIDWSRKESKRLAIFLGELIVDGGGSGTKPVLPPKKLHGVDIMFTSFRTVIHSFTPIISSFLLDASASWSIILPRK